MKPSTLIEYKGNSGNTVPLIIEENYSTFQDFYQKEKPTIYKKIAEIFEDSVRQDIEMKLIVLAKVNGSVFDTTFLISKDNESLITEKVIPYLEEIEEYEICGRLLKVRSEKSKIDKTTNGH